jgi:ADP-heptose:LPS heptosyltransferase
MRSGRIGVLKPDHLGDLVLSIPAISILRERLGVLDLIVSPSNVSLAGFLFGKDQAAIPVAFAHLDKAGKTRQLATPFPYYDTLISLRRDSWINANWLRTKAKNVFLLQEDPNHKLHETEVHRLLLKPIVGDYDPTSIFMSHTNKLSTKESAMPGTVGLCISAGHSSNSWPIANWIKLSSQLLQLGFRPFFIGGPQEAAELQVAKQALNLSDSQIIIGTQDFNSFLTKVASVEVIIASDSGTAHLCSISHRPIISLFGPSPHKRFRPIGPQNHVITLDLNCSPCVQFSTNELNLCVSRECMNSIDPRLIIDQIVEIRHQLPQPYPST